MRQGDKTKCKKYYEEIKLPYIASKLGHISLSHLFTYTCYSRKQVGNILCKSSMQISYDPVIIVQGIFLREMLAQVQKMRGIFIKVVPDGV